jgi:hypothetical protein
LPSLRGANGSGLWPARCRDEPIQNWKSKNWIASSQVLLAMMKTT